MLRYTVSKPQLDADEANAVLQVILSGRITQGPTVEQFEHEFANLLHVKYAVACSNGTTALHLALAALNISVGDEVIVPDLTYVATANAVRYTGAWPVLVDVYLRDWNINIELVEKAITARTRAIIPVHLYGQPCNMDELKDLAKRRNLYIVEDAAEALGGSFKGIPCGTHGRCGTFSFYGNKIITTGEGGAVVTNEEDLAKRLKLLRGQAVSPTQRFWHSEIGFNYRMTEMQAAVGLVQLKKFPRLLQARHRVVTRYITQLCGQFGVRVGVESAPWLFTVELPESIAPGRVAKLLEQQGIETRPVFTPMHLLPMHWDQSNNFPVSTHASQFGLSLPTYPELQDDDVDFICAALKEAVWDRAMTRSKTS